MTTLAYVVPIPGTDLNSIADPEIATALTSIKSWANGNIDAGNLVPGLIPGAAGSWLTVTASGLQDGATSAAATGTNPLAIRIGAGQVFFSGMGYNPSLSAIATGATLFTIPSAAIPNKNIYLAAANSGTTAAAMYMFKISAGSANVNAFDAFPNTTTFSFEGLSYRLI